MLILLYISAVFEVLRPEIILVRGCKQVEAGGQQDQEQT